MESRMKTILTVRWIQWFFSAFSFGVCLAYFLTDVNFYLWMPTVFRAQVGLAGVLHVYLYLAAIWISVKPQGLILWAVLDVVFSLIAVAVVGTGQSSLSEYCSKSSLTLFWSDANFAYVPLDQRASSDTSTLSEVISSDYMARACGMNAGVVAANGILIILFAITAFLQFKQYRDDREESKRYLSRQEKIEQEQQSGGWRRSLAAPFTRGKPVNIEV